MLVEVEKAKISSHSSKTEFWAQNQYGRRFHRLKIFYESRINILLVVKKAKIRLQTQNTVRRPQYQ
jgi:hypothetical protein